MENKDKIPGSNHNKNHKTHPKERANIISQWFFCWSLPIFIKGFKKELDEDDLYKPLAIHESNKLGDAFEKAWKKDTKLHTKASLWRVIFKIHGLELAQYGVMPIFMDLVFKLSHPLLLKNLMEYYVPNQTSVTENQAYIYISLIILTSFFNVVLNYNYIIGLRQIGMKIRIACCSIIYRKALRLSRDAMAETTVGQMVNLMANDVRRFDFTFLHFHNLWLAPVEIFVVMYLIYITLGAAAITGLGVLLLFIPVQMFMAKKASGYRMRTALKTDHRIRLMNEIISGIMVIKMYTWEKPFAKLIESARHSEILQIRGASYLRAFIVSFMMFLTKFSIFTCILAYVLTGNVLQAQYVYVVSSFYDVLRTAITSHIPQGVLQLVETSTSIKRIEKFLEYSEREEIAKDKKSCGVHMGNVTVKWPDFTLKHVNFDAEPKQLVAIIGTVGSGKTTLLQVILQELPLVSGILQVGGKISYASQEPWIFSGSVQQNILFGQELDEKKYKEILRICALESDLSLFPNGDRTVVGEKGVMLSGGQKARISLARSIYKDADIYLLDDPLSAVDTHVGKQLFEDCICEYLKKKCTVLVTHQLQYLKSADKIYVCENGTVTKSDHIQIKETKEETKQDNNDNTGKKNNSKNDKRAVKEHKSTGNVSNRVYGKYLKAGGSCSRTFFVFLMFVLAQAASGGTDYFLMYWVNSEQDRLEANISTVTGEIEVAKFNNVTSSTIESSTSLRNLYVYSGLIVLTVTITLARSLNFFKYTLKVAQNLHKKMFMNISYATMRFYHTNPSGRILNRFAKDIGGVDEALPNTLAMTLQDVIQVFAVTMLICSVNPWLFIPTIVIFVVFYCYKVFFLSTTRNLKRIEGITRSPVFSHLTASLQGITTIRAFQAQEILQREFDSHQDLHSSAFYTFMASARTFGFWLDLNCIIYIGIVTLSFLFIGTETYGGKVGLAITQSITLTGVLQRGMRQWSELENQMTSVERVVEYTELTPEPDFGKIKPSRYWPSEGIIQFRSVSMKYSETDPVVLKNLNFIINSKQKIGIVGRTGAGKSSLITALFRLASIEGEIFIDGVNTKEISLNSLRSKISIIPQDPVLFSGTLRKNLDPFEEYDDQTLWNGLEQVELKAQVSELPAGLHYNVLDGGANFSVGQKQLLCLARAVVRNNKILVLDEATANVDPQTDELIQKTIRKKFVNCTVLTIAHRLHTIMDADKVLVMDQGQVIEFDHPHVLLEREGALYNLVKQTGTEQEHLEDTARKNYELHVKA